MERDQQLTVALIRAVEIDNIALLEDLIRKQGADVNGGTPARRLGVGEQVLIAGTRKSSY